MVNKRRRAIDRNMKLGNPSDAIHPKEIFGVHLCWSQLDTRKNHLDVIAQVEQ